MRKPARLGTREHTRDRNEAQRTISMRYVTSSTTNSVGAAKYVCVKSSMSSASGCASASMTSSSVRCNESESCAGVSKQTAQAGGAAYVHAEAVAAVGLRSGEQQLRKQRRRDLLRLHELRTRVSARNMSGAGERTTRAK